jgi:hypothetical protein
VLDPKTTNERKTMTRPTKDMTTKTMTREQLLALFQGDDALRRLLQTTVQEVLEAEMVEALGATKGERTDERRGEPQRLLPCPEGRAPQGLLFWLQNSMRITRDGQNYDTTVSRFWPMSWSAKTKDHGVPRRGHVLILDNAALNSFRPAPASEPHRLDSGATEISYDQALVWQRESLLPGQEPKAGCWEPPSFRVWCPGSDSNR